ncbi:MULTISPECIES: hypothetical protein [Prochlorococcus]|nr:MULTISPECIES: hypothetical protein [Prochlorococcus]NMP05029.1 hypothetical protein [Prochlorococcus sp. P1361]
MDLSLNRYRPLVEGRDQDLLDALRALSEEKKQAGDSCLSICEAVWTTD